MCLRLMLIASRDLGTALWIGAVTETKEVTKHGFASYKFTATRQAMIVDDSLMIVDYSR